MVRKVRISHLSLFLLEAGFFLAFASPIELTNFFTDHSAAYKKGVYKQPHFCLSAAVFLVLDSTLLFIIH